MLSPWLAACSNHTSWKHLLQSAGDAEDEEVALGHLKKILQIEGLDPEIKNPLEALINFMDQWLHGKAYAHLYQGTGLSDAYLCGFFSGKSSPDQWLLPEQSEEHPLFPLIGYYRAKMLIAEVIEKGELSHVPEKRKQYYSTARKLLEVAQAAYPKNEAIGMYLNEPIPWELPFSPTENAPQWARDQRETLTKLQNIFHWWVDERQLPSGQFGGGWGDDVEMWRQWIPLLLGFEDKVMEESQRKLSSGLFATDRIVNGYSNKIFDVEHTAEDTADTITAMLHIDPNDAEWEQRAMHLLHLMDTRWTGENERGHLQFKSTYFTADLLDSDPRKACDTLYHPRTIQPVLLLWQRTGNNQIGHLVKSWMDTWVDATMRSEKGKPAGILPSAIHWPDGTIGGITDTWWDPGNHTEDPLYVWPSAMDMMLNTLLLTWHISGDEHYLLPLHSMSQQLQQNLDRLEEPATTGTLMWCVKQMPDFLPDILSKYRLLSSDTQYDDLLERYADGYTWFRLSGDRSRLEEEISRQQQAFAFNERAFKQEVRWTDRVFRFHAAYYNDWSAKPIPSYQSGFLFQCLTGNVGNALYFPINAVKWLTQPIDIAVLVVKANTEKFVAELFHFGNDNRSMGALLYLLDPGSYDFSIQTATTTLENKRLILDTSNRQINFSIPPQQKVIIALQEYEN